jgi:hypothetical protein
MALKFALFENHLTTDPDDYMAVVQDLRSKTQEDVIDLMISRGSTVTKAEALSVLEEYAGAIVLLLKDGYAINTPIFNLSPSIKGTFYGPDEAFNSSAHAVKINITAGTRLREVGQQVAVERVKGGSPQPDPEYLDDLGSDTRNEQLTPGNIARLRGSRLKFESGDLMQGVFLIAADTTVTRVATVSRNKPGEIDFLVPVLAPGVYRLEVRAVIFQSKTLRVGVLPALLTVG